ncbi:MAG: small multi-drug export protein [Desulfobacterota bacterium]|nr:small multi-drug export protein [Thermodesulfobacteriota bacterium]
MDWLHWLKEYYLFHFFGLYILGGRPAALLSAQWLGQDLFFFLPLVVALDTLQIPLFYRVYEGMIRFPGLARLKTRLEKRRDGARLSRSWQFWSAWKGGGVFLITALPVKGGGMWSGVLMAFSLQIPKQVSYPLLIGGSTSGCLLLLLFGGAVGLLWS